MMEKGRSMAFGWASDQVRLWSRQGAASVRSRDEWIHWALVAFVFLLPFPLFGPDGRNVLLYVLLVVWFHGRKAGARLTEDQARLGWGLLIYLLAAGMSVSVSPDAGVSLREIQRLPLNGLILFLILAKGQGSPVRLRHYVMALVCASGLVAGYGLIGLFSGRAQLAGIPTSVYAWKNELGYLLAVSITIVIWKLLTTSDRIQRAGWAILALAQFWLLILSYTRAALVAVIVSTLILTVALRRMKVLLVCIVAFMTLLAVSGQRIVTRHLSIVQPSTYVAGNLSGRVDLWGGTLAMIKRQPLRGYGFGAPLFARTARAFADQTGDARATLGSHAHNLFLEAAFETGLFGLAALSLLGGTVAWVLIKRCRVSQSRDAPRREIAVLFLAIYAVMIVISMTDYLLLDRFGVLGWTLFACTGALASETPWHGGTEETVAGPPFSDASARRLPGRDRL